MAQYNFNKGTTTKTMVSANSEIRLLTKTSLPVKIVLFQKFDEKK